MGLQNLMTVHLNMLPYNLPNSKNSRLPNIKYLWFLLPFSKFQLLSDDKKTKFTIKEIILRGTIIAGIISIPSLITFAVVWIIFDDLMTGAILGVVVHFIAMGFSLKISKKLLVK